MTGEKMRYAAFPLRQSVKRSLSSEAEHPDVLVSPGEDRPGWEGSRVAIGRTRAGRYLRVIYVLDPEPDGVFVVTAFELRGKPLTAYRRRLRRKGRK